jgi:hypothetical protein
VGDQLGFLHDLKRREREADQPLRGLRTDTRRESIIEAEFHEVTDRDSSA